MSHHVIIQGKLRHLGGWKPDRPDHPTLELPAGVSLAPIPAKADVLAGLPSVKDQGNIGSCTAHASTSAMEYLETHAKRPEVDLSRLFVYYASRVWVEGDDPLDDAGAAIRDVMKAVRLYGACLETLWPYEPAHFSFAPPRTCQHEALGHVITANYRCPNLASIKQSIADGFPVVIGFSVPQSMMTDEVARTGVVPYPGPDEAFVGGHCILLVGYDDATGLLRFRNSWSTGWGVGGDGFLPYRFVTDGLATDAWTIRNEKGI